MGRKPVLGLAGMFLAGVTLTGCECTDWCCFGNNKTTTTTTTPAARPAPNWTTPPMNQTQPVTPAQPSSTGANRFGTPTTPPANQPGVVQETSALPARDLNGAAQPDSFQSSPTAATPEINPPTPPGGDRRPVSALPMNDANVIPPPAVPRSSTPGVRIAPPIDSPTTPASKPLPPLDSSVTPPATPEPPSNYDVPAPPAPLPAKGDGTTQSSSKYQQTTGPSLDVPPPPPRPGVPPMPGSGPSEN
jgi:hypothetical protein